MILVGCWTDDAAGAPVKALKETAEADAYATSLHEAAEIAVDAARRYGPGTGTASATWCRSPGYEQSRGGSFGQRGPAQNVVSAAPRGQSSSSQRIEKVVLGREIGRAGP